MDTVEAAYHEIARSIIDYIAGRPWDSAVCSARILSKMTRLSWHLTKAGTKDDKSVGWGDSSIDASGAAFFLRDDLLHTTGQRIWGLTFTLYPTGKFNIEYDYSKPEGYEETDEVITGDEINQTLNQLTGKGN